jgi:hypothetical protein
MAREANLYQPADWVIHEGLNEAAVAALKLLQEWQYQRHPRRWPARLEWIDRCTRMNDDGDQDLDICDGR